MMPLAPFSRDLESRPEVVVGVPIISANEYILIYPNIIIAIGPFLRDSNFDWVVIVGKVFWDELCRDITTLVVGYVRRIAVSIFADLFLVFRVVMSRGIGGTIVAGTIVRSVLSCLVVIALDMPIKSRIGCVKLLNVLEELICGLDVAKVSKCITLEEGIVHIEWQGKEDKYQPPSKSGSKEH